MATTQTNEAMLRWQYLLALLPALSLFLLNTSVADESGDATAMEEVTPEQAAFFETKIRPVLVDRCLECHSGDEPESGLNLETRAGMLHGGELGIAVLPGKPAQSLLIGAIRHDEFIKMPPKEKLPTAQIVDFTKWVEMGAPWPDSQPVAAVATGESEPVMQFTEEQRTHWAFQPLSDPMPPDDHSGWSRTPIDQFMLARLNSAGLKPAAPADKRTLIRRATFDLWGLPPTPDEVKAFLNDDSPDAFAKVVERLLASPHYGERWARHWLDVVRYADSNGLDENLSYANAFRYRDYVISAFNGDKPYARFVQEQIAGDLLPRPDDEQQNIDRYVATGFLAIGPKMLAEDDPVKMQMDIIDEQISTLGQAFMGLTIGCARCHDHKFDPLPTQDYYSLAGIFKSSRTMENHKVVAVWYERPLVSRAVDEQIAAIDAEVAAITRDIEQIKSRQREHIAQHLQSSFGSYLLAAAACDRLQEQNEPRREALSDTDNAHPVRYGYALIEAEAFHRGNVERLFDGYGQGIGVIATSGAGFAEFDIDMDRAGQYVLEMRYAAVDSRPVQLSVNGQVVADSVAGQTTGSWHPDGQRWFATAPFELKQGANTLKLDSPRVWPHIDRLAVVYHGPEPWPFDVPAPASLTQIASQFRVSVELVAVWRDFLKRIEVDSETPFPSFRLWQAFAGINDEHFSRGSKALLDELSSSDGFGATTPALLKRSLLEASPQSLTDVSSVYQQLLDSTIDNDGLKEEWLHTESPLQGPSEIVASMLPGEAQERLLTLEKSLETTKSSRPTYDVAMGITEDTPQDLRIHLRGSHIALGKVAPRRFPRIFDNAGTSEITEQESGRRQLAEWLTNPDHPLVGRVIVNRAWHWRFGRGLTPSVDNFGLLGQPPTHPELLDWLTRWFLDGGGSLKDLHRMMMLSSTYRISTSFDDTSDAVDPENKLLWRFRRRRLSAEEMRDSLIAIGTRLDETMSGSLLKVANRSYVTGSGTNITDEYDNLRRSVYLPVVRSAVYDVFQTFDFPDPAVAAGSRQTSTVAPQALMMMNSKLVEQQTLALAKRLLILPSDQERVTTAFALILNREPSDQEIETCTQYLDRARQSLHATHPDPQEATIDAWQSYCRVLLSSNEFAYVE